MIKAALIGTTILHIAQVAVLLTMINGLFRLDNDFFSTMLLTHDRTTRKPEASQGDGGQDHHEPEKGSNPTPSATGDAFPVSVDKP